MRASAWPVLLVVLAGCATGSSDGGFDLGEDEPAASGIEGSGGGESGDGGSNRSSSSASQGNGGSSTATAGTGGSACEPTTYEKSSGFGSGSVTTCCEDGDALVAVVDCGVGDNHGVQQDGACGIGYEGEMNNGSPCVTLTCATGCDGSSSASSSSSSSGSGGGDPGSCAHAKCDQGEALDPSCDPCVASICADDPYCCDVPAGGWDDLCVNAVAGVCGETC